MNIHNVFPFIFLFFPFWKVVYKNLIFKNKFKFKKIQLVLLTSILLLKKAIYNIYKKKMF